MTLNINFLLIVKGWEVLKGRANCIISSQLCQLAFKEKRFDPLILNPYPAYGFCMSIANMSPVAYQVNFTGKFSSSVRSIQDKFFKEILTFQTCCIKLSLSAAILNICTHLALYWTILLLFLAFQKSVNFNFLSNAQFKIFLVLSLSQFFDFWFYEVKLIED